jgi:hypothetical protein
MIKAAIDRIIELTRPSTFQDQDGIERFTSSENPVGMPTKAHDPAICSSLASLCEFAKEKGRSFFEINGPSLVALVDINKYDGQEKKEIICSCKAILPEAFPFGQFRAVDDFIIKVCDYFERDESFKSLIADVSAITDFQSSDVLDDGVTQEATTKSGIGRKDKTKINPFRTLKAYRTFRDIEQPITDYLLRIQKGEKAPQVALFEASGYGWKVAAIDAIAEFIRREIPTAMVLK